MHVAQILFAEIRICLRKNVGFYFASFFLAKKYSRVHSLRMNSLHSVCQQCQSRFSSNDFYSTAMHTSIQKCDRKSCRNYIYSESFFIRRNFPGKEGVCWRHISTKPCVSIHTQATILFLNTFAGMIKEVYGN